MLAIQRPHRTTSLPATRAVAPTDSNSQPAARPPPPPGAASDFVEPGATSLQQLLARRPELKTNQDLINYFWAIGGRTWSGSEKAAAANGAAMGELIGNRSGSASAYAEGKAGSRPSTTPTAPASWQSRAAEIGALLERPAGLDQTAAEKLWFLKTGSPKLSPRPLTEAEGRKVFFDGMLPIASSKEAFRAASPTVAQTPSWARDAPCAYSTSWRLEQACRDAGRPDLAGVFEDHGKQATTHEVEIALRNLGFSYYPKSDYVAPRGAIGAWSRYDFHGWKQHTGHVFTILEDGGPDGRKDRIADNNGSFDHLYTPSGKCEGFWLPPGVYPVARGARPPSTEPSTGPTTTGPTTTPPASTTGAATLPTLRQGARGAAVEELQRGLKAAGFSPGTVDGDFGPKTLKAVRALQSARGLVVDGVVGPKTWAALKAGAAEPRPRPEPQPAEVTTERTRPLGVGGVSVYKVQGKRGLAFTSEMTIDADGSPHAYHPQSGKGLDALGNAGRPGNWWGIATDSNGKPYVQKAGDPAPGYYVSTTALADSRWPASDPRRYVNSEEIPFIAIPPALQTAGCKLGDIVAVRNTRNGRLCYAVIADIGPGDHLGEGSMRLARELGINDDPRSGGASGGVQYVAFPGSKVGWPLTHERIQEEGARLFAAWGGPAQLASATRS